MTTLPQNFTRLRFLHGASGCPPLDIYAGGRNFVRKLGFGELTPYSAAADGLMMLSLNSGEKPHSMLLNSGLELSCKSPLTLAVIHGEQGLEILGIKDEPPCHSAFTDSNFRVVNLVCDSPPLNLQLSSGGTVLKDIFYTNASDYLATKPGLYSFCLVTADDATPLLSFALELKKSANYTIYLLGGGSEISLLTTIRS